MISAEHRPKIRKTAFDIKSLIGNGNDKDNIADKREEIEVRFNDRRHGHHKHGSLSPSGENGRFLDVTNAVNRRQQPNAVVGYEKHLLQLQHPSSLYFGGVIRPDALLSTAVPAANKKCSCEHVKCPYQHLQCKNEGNDDGSDSGNEQEWLKKMSSDCDAASELAQYPHHHVMPPTATIADFVNTTVMPVPLTAATGMAMQQQLRAGSNGSREICEQQQRKCDYHQSRHSHHHRSSPTRQCNAHAREAGSPLAPAVPRFTTTEATATTANKSIGIDARIMKAHYQHMNNAVAVIAGSEKYRYFPAFNPHVVAPEMPPARYIMQSGLMPAFSAGYSRPDLMASHQHHHHGGRRIRTTFTRSQLKVLEKRFKSSHYIVGDERKQLAEELGLNESQVKIWFQNRRTKYKQDKEFEDLGKSKTVKRKGEHHIRKWLMETQASEAQCSSSSSDSDDTHFHFEQDKVSQIAPEFYIDKLVDPDLWG
eukprot:gene5338-6008_t